MQLCHNQPINQYTKKGIITMINYPPILLIIVTSIIIIIIITAIITIIPILILFLLNTTSNDFSRIEKWNKR